VGIAQKAAQLAIDHARRKKTAKPQAPYLIGEMNNDLVAAEVQLNDMLRIANNYDFEPIDQNGHDILTRKTNVANASIRVVTKAMEIAGGEGFYRSFSVWSGCFAMFRRRVITRCRKVTRWGFQGYICCATDIL
jgi:alkylation response protein AidB-like acyl-CoA dehydrogenase